MKRINQSSHILISSLTLFLIVLLSACGKKTEKAQKGETEKENPELVTLTEAQFKTSKIQFGNIEKQKLGASIKVNGLLDVPPQQLVSITVPMGGILKSTALLQGMWVTQGEVIATLEHPDYIQLQQDYLNNKSQLDFMEKEYTRQKELNQENVSAIKTLQKTESEYRSLKSNLQGLEQKLSMLNISAKKIETEGIRKDIFLTSPINGYVTKVNVNIGKYVNAFDVLFEIVDTRHLHAELTVFEKDVPFLKIGDKVYFQLSNESKERTATIHLIGREISPDRTIRVHSHLDHEDKELIPGTYFKARVESSDIEVNAVPDNAVVQAEGKNFIFIAQENSEKNTNEFHFKRMEIKTGLKEGGFTEVILPEGFDIKAKVVVKGAYDLISKMLNSAEEE
ncbi:MAG: CzcABC family efflux RND transporter, membrane fusion protein [Cytophagales bacterium]|jgi:cobalt-zinc-cadmium efflux system membrane fusion protein|nr:efflux RND transporter periplasmic adaptor subunit [Bacteroidota bacterium]MBS1950743.1 efflux RND transporter periplasmic adaptor subunit [Bacteroidota bacterium]MBS1980697.1 efflux RND transporter periplasmic adaptor subunit [Bacteroidota bacterium]WHZ08028.1 MAG: CzcABC family efflux RND transporter, membrane fusion protein [Cytophagales bacterium]